MKIKNKYFLIFIIFVYSVILIDTLGLDQLDKVHVNDIIISKPLGYKYSSISSLDDNSPKKIFQNIHGLQTKHIISDSSLLSLKFEQKFLLKKTSIYFKKLSDFSKKILKVQKKTLTCTKLEIKNENDLYTSRIIYKLSIDIDILSNNKEDLIYFYKQICN